MKHIKQYSMMFEGMDNRPVISYDFDGCLHTSVRGLDPHDFFDHESWVPFEEYHEKMREDAKDHRIVIVTARDQHMLPPVREFVKLHDLPVDEIIATDNMPKYDTLKRIGSVKHYDDNAKMGPVLKAMGIEFEQTYPFGKPVMETCEGDMEDMLSLVRKRTDGRFEQLHYGFDYIEIKLTEPDYDKKQELQKDITDELLRRFDKNISEVYAEETGWFKIYLKMDEADRKLGACYSTKTKEKYVYIYRACDKSVGTFKDMDYVTMSRKFAREHAESNHVANEEPQHVIRAFVKTEYVFEAYNPGEYFYHGPEQKGNVDYESLGPGKYGVDESLSSRTRFELVFTNPNFFISDNTLSAFVRRLQRMDASLEYDPKMNGQMQRSKIIYVTSAVLQFGDVKAEADSFCRRYDGLQMQVLPKALRESKESAEQWFKMKQMHDKMKADKAADKKAQLDKTELEDKEIPGWLEKVKSNKMDMADLPVYKKLQSMGLVRQPRGVEVQSSFSRIFYLTNKGEEKLKSGK